MGASRYVVLFLHASFPLSSFSAPDALGASSRPRRSQSRPASVAPANPSPHPRSRPGKTSTPSSTASSTPPPPAPLARTPSPRPAPSQALPAHQAQAQGRAVRDARRRRMCLRQGRRAGARAGSARGVGLGGWRRCRVLSEYQPRRGEAWEGLTAGMELFRKSRWSMWIRMRRSTTCRPR